jgi:hypothetical protein
MTMRTRLSRLEATAPTADFSHWHRAIGQTEAECDELRRSMITAGQAENSDHFVYRIVARPCSEHLS